MLAASGERRTRSTVWWRARPVKKHWFRLFVSTQAGQVHPVGYGENRMIIIVLGQRVLGSLQTLADQRFSFFQSLLFHIDESKIVDRPKGSLVFLSKRLATQCQRF